MTELENELARAKATLQQLMPESEDPNNQFSFAEPIKSPRKARRVDIPRSYTHPAAIGDHAAISHMPAASYEPPERRGSIQRLPGHDIISLETSPLSGNWEWDERTGRANGNKFVDGMASLTSDPNEGGYLGKKYLLALVSIANSEPGVASGAALLRVTDPSPNASASDHIGSAQNSERPNPSVPSIPFAMTSLGQLEPFVEAYFTVFHRSYPIVHEATFRAQFMEVIPRPQSNSWQVLLFTVAAIGAFTASTYPSDTDLGLFGAAKARMSIDVLETGNILLVQALTLISNYMQKRNKPNSGYNYMGLARRTAMAIGLHKEIQTPETNLFMREMRRRVWYCLYIFDVGAIITFSRPLDFPHNGVDVKLPMNVHDTVSVLPLSFFVIH